MSGIFISYRREDSGPYAGRLRDILVKKFGKKRVFWDLDSIEGGDHVESVIEKTVSTCDALIAVIGTSWLTVSEQVGEEVRPRLDNPEDLVRLEIEAALNRDIRVIPVLVGLAESPSRDELPDSLKPLADRHAFRVSDGTWDYDVGRLIRTLRRTPGLRTGSGLFKALSNLPLHWKIGSVVVISVILAVMFLFSPTSPRIPVPELSIFPRQVSFTDQEPRQVTVRNESGATVKLEEARLTGVDSQGFKILQDRCSGRELPTDGECEIQIGLSRPPERTTQAQLVIAGVHGDLGHVVLNAEISEARPPIVTVPNLLDQTYNRELIQGLEDKARLHVGRVTKEQSSSPENTVLAQEPAAGAEVPIGTTVNLKLATQEEPEKSVVPVSPQWFYTVPYWAHGQEKGDPLYCFAPEPPEGYVFVRSLREYKRALKSGGTCNVPSHLCDSAGEFCVDYYLERGCYVNDDWLQWFKLRLETQSIKLNEDQFASRVCTGST